MKTVIIWDSCGQEPIKFFVVDEDLSRFHNKYVNSTNITETESEEISLLVYDEGGQQKTPLLDTFPAEEVKNGAQVVVCGFLP